MCLDRFDRDRQPTGDFFVGVAAGQMPENLLFSWCEAIQVIVGCFVRRALADCEGVEHESSQARRENGVAVAHPADGVDHIVTHTLPGTLEFPFAASEVVQANPEVDAIVCLGVVLKGDTYHFEMIIDECVRGLGEVSRAARVPIVNEVLPVTELADAEARAGDDGFNKGIEAAAAAIEIIHWRRQLGQPAAP